MRNRSGCLLIALCLFFSGTPLVFAYGDKSNELRSSEYFNKKVLPPEDTIRIKSHYRALNNLNNKGRVVLAANNQLDKENQALLDEMYIKAKKAKKEVDNLAERIANSYGGSVAKAPLKSRHRAIEKIINNYGGNASRISDLVRNTIIVPASKVGEVAETLSGHGAKVQYKTAKDDPLGYSGVNSKIMTRAGIYGEIQVNSPIMIFAKETEEFAKSLIGLQKYHNIKVSTGIIGGFGHRLYEKWRVLNPKDERAQSIAKLSRAYYEYIRGVYASCKGWEFCP
jgi:hypothetical protein